LARQGMGALPTAVTQNKDTEIVVMCHHGIRSAQVVAWLRQQGWTNVWNMTGGIDAYATAVDPTIGRY
ncbi:MAG: rhodanese-like domain-containing protein, partial [Anaerolineae bacterium]